MVKERADLLLVQQGLADSREKAKRYIMAGQVYDDKQQRIDKAGEKIDSQVQLQLKGEEMPYVSRGGLKLDKARQVFGIDFIDKIVLDIGSSTGGFTDVALQNGAQLSYALDVGTNQLAWKLRNDDRVIVMEQTNFRYSQLADFTHGQPEIATIDVSFISLALILPNLSHIIAPGGQVVALIKPQFEAGRDQVGKKGLVRDKKVHIEVIHKVAELACQEGFNFNNLDYSPITGGTGNIEFLAHLERTQAGLGQFNPQLDIPALVDQAHQNLLGK
ncbi:cell division protein FtsJ [Aerococcus urinaehominis]|uniref:Cell division protein FtsJ n=1 Tax=Aerococcus urinaehominis TaxID=128944 RepID=A0A120IAQ7_9LACT|nr:TlyA family RNA methyltransferase [Aerococcus urinaehominis]AMB98858.1 cell division protein FtsJ [Aerococcus urinaehominis]SDM17062.1 23S rRNA (cytidine1920-2'-O)/16S rRNA (cytidine1409-2'-O)-methyltransferase [Aerococcus urinaehominis]